MIFEVISQKGVDFRFIFGIINSMNYERYFDSKRTVLAILIVGRRAWLISAVLLFLLTSLAWPKNEACLKWEPEVDIAGTLTNIGEMPNTYWKLILPTPICISGKVDGDIDFSENDIHDLHLMLYKRQYPKYEHLLSKRVVVTGYLYPAHMPHHISKVLLVSIRNIRLIENKE